MLELLVYIKEEILCILFVGTSMRRKRKEKESNVLKHW
jgi:hypothetical protein